MSKILALDLGSVLINVDKTALYKNLEFLKISEQEIAAAFFKEPRFENFQKGILREEQYLIDVKNDIIYPEELSRIGTYLLLMQLQDAFMSMVTWRPASFQILNYCRNNHHPYVFWSNINSLHLQKLEFEKHLYAPKNKSNIRNTQLLQSIFSHQVHALKPEQDFFTKALSLNKHQAKNILFIDDKIGNIKAAQNFGIEAVQLIKPTFDQLLPFALRCKS